MHLSVNNWEFLAELLNCGYPLMDALSFLHINQSIIQNALEKGLDLQEVLIQKQGDRFSEHLMFFLKITPLPQAIQSSLQLLRFEKGLQKKLLKSAAYPLFIFIFAFIMLWIFSSMIIPQMLQSFEVSNDFHSLMILVQFIKGSCILVTCLFICLFLFYLVLRKSTLLRISFLNQLHHKVPMIADYISYLFSGYLIELEKRGVSTKQAMLYLKMIKKESLFAFFIGKLSMELENGLDMLSTIEQCSFLNASFRLSFRVGASASSLEDTLLAFMKQQEYVWQQLIKKVSIVIQCIAYGFVGVVVLIVFQIMLIPLNMLENM
ncbi:MAG: type II secretion protein F [Longicatena sp.]